MVTKPATHDVITNTHVKLNRKGCNLLAAALPHGGEEEDGVNRQTVDRWRRSLLANFKTMGLLIG